MDSVKTAGRWIAVALAATALCLLLAAADAAGSAEAGVAVTVENIGGGMVTYYVKYQLDESGLLHLARTYPSGKLIEERQVQLDGDRLDTIRQVVAASGLEQVPPGQVESPSITRALNATSDSPAWRVTLVAANGSKVEATVPPKIASRVVPELEQSPLVTAVWRLTDEFYAEWSRAERIQP